MACDHKTVKVSANTHAQLSPVTNLPIARMLNIQASCADCGVDFWFPGLGSGIDYTKPTTDHDGFNLVVPLVEQNKQNNLDPSLVSTSIRMSDTLKGRKLL